MRPLDQLNAYLDRMRRRLIYGALAQGAAIAAVCALVATVALVAIVDRFAFSETSLTWSRTLLFLSVAFAIAFAIVVPVLAVTRKRAAQRAEAAAPEFNQQLVTCVESEPSPFVDLLAKRTMNVAQHVAPERVITPVRLAGFGGASLAALGVLAWLILAGPGYMGHGAALLWGGTPKAGASPFYDIQVTPGDKIVRRKADQVIAANLVGFQSASARLKARYKGTTKWEEAPMIPATTGGGFEFLFSSLAEEVDYYVEANGIRSKEFKLSVADLPSVKKIRVTYNYPKWTGQTPEVEDPGGDLRAIEGTEAQLEITMDRPLKNGLISIDGQETKIETDASNVARAVVPVKKDGTYHIATVERAQNVRLTDDYFIEAQKESEPTVKLSRPGRDLKVSPIEEVTLEVTGDDDFGLREMALHYSVNGGEEKTVAIATRGAKTASGTKLLELEQFKLMPGDVVSVYATAKDARTTARTDIHFLEAQPFEREYSQSQQSGGGGGGGEGGDQNQIARRQKEIIAATWNEIRDKSGDKKKAAEDAKFLNEVQAKLQAQALTLAQRMRARELSGAAESFAAFAKDMEAASKAMGPAAEALKSQKWKEALPHEQQALQHLLRAEARFKEIQVAFGGAGGGGGGSQSGRDLESLFDLELDTEKNQYETGQQSASSGDRQREVDEALQKLEALARRQQELAQAQRNKAQTPEQRWQQEMLRREVEELKRQMERMQQQGQQSAQSQSGQQGQQGQSGQQGQQGQQQAGQQGQQSGQAGQGGQSGQQSATQQRLSSMASGRSGQAQSDPRLRRALDQMQQAAEDMRRANQSGQRDETEARRAAERLEDAKNLLSGARREQTSGQLGELADRTQKLAAEQRAFNEKLKRQFGQAQTREQMDQQAQRTTPQQNAQMADEKTRIMKDFQDLERDLQAAARSMQGAQRGASNKLRESLGELQQEELGVKMKFMSEWLRRGLGAYAWNREQTVTNALDKLAEGVSDAARRGGENAQQSAQTGRQERALSQLEELRRQMNAMSGNGRQQGNQQGGQQPGRQPGQQPGQQAGQQGRQGGQQGGQGSEKGGGMQGGAQQSGDQRGDGGERGMREFSAMNRGDYRPQVGDRQVPQQQFGQAQIERAYTDSLRELRGLREQLGANPETRAEIDRLIAEMQRLDPARFPGNPALVDKMRTQILPSLEALELQLRRQMEEGQGGQARTASSDRMPAGYAGAVAEYFRKLSKSKP